jgi:formamidopyrimidine-DNA glycosylase
MVMGVSARKLPDLIMGRKILKVHRRGKYLVLELKKSSLIFHLGMTGQLIYIPGNKKIQSVKKDLLTGTTAVKESSRVDQHTRFIFDFSKGGQMLFKDARTFGKLIYIPDGNWLHHPRVLKLGPEPLELKPKQFLKQTFPVSSRRPIKALLLDQSFVCGVGNIYCDESLFLSRIHPNQPANTLTENQWYDLLKSIKRVLRLGIKNAGTTFSDYRKPDGSSGSNRDKLLVYGRGGESCKICGNRLKKIKVAQRGTVFCTRCQPLKARSNR